MTPDYARAAAHVRAAERIMSEDEYTTAALRNLAEWLETLRDWATEEAADRLIRDTRMGP